MLKSKIFIISAAVVAVIAVGGAGVVIGMSHKAAQKPVAAVAKPQTQTQTSDSNASELSKAHLYKVGDTVKFASQTLTVNSARTTNELSSQYGQPYFADSGTKFVVVNMTITNTTTTPFMYNPFAVIDQKNRFYQAYDKTAMAIDDYLTIKQLSPSVPLTGEEVYQVPQDSTDFRIGAYTGNSNNLQLVQFQAN